MNVATNPTEIKRRTLFGMIPALAAVTATPALAFQLRKPMIYDPLPEWWAELKKTRAEIDDLAAQPGGGNYDTPEILAFAGREQELEKLIATTRPTSVAGACAQIEWVNMEIELELVWEFHREALANAIAFLQGGMV